ncbi:MAG: M3 family oligoendopeptidase [Bacteroidetes bacterium]|nr:M3 family oligoendopeptidase [Bacteroidota bacterium]
MLAEDVRWDLSHLYATPDALRTDLARTLDEASALEAAFAGRLATLATDELAAFFQRLEAVHDAMGRAYTYAFLAWATNTLDADAGALLQEVKEAYATFSRQLVFVEVEWAALDEDAARRRYDAPEMARYRHYLEVQTERRRHVLSEKEERVLITADLTGRGAWTRFFDQTLAAATFELRGETMSETDVLAKLHSDDRSLRRDAAEALTAGLERLAPTLAYVFNTVLLDKAEHDALRGFDTWVSARNASNEVDDAVVEALVASVTARYDLAQRFYRLKARLLGVEEMADYDRYAPLPQASGEWSWEAAKESVIASYKAFRPKAGQVVARFFDERWIDAPAAVGKRGGAFSHSAVPSAHPYVLMNFTGRVRDVQTLAHELGHGLHQYLAREQGVFHADTPLTTAETASVFGEMLTYQRLLQTLDDPKERLALMVAKLDDTMATVFRQVSMNRFEHAIHTARRAEGELSADRFGELWMTTQTALYGDSVALGVHYRRWWSYIPHFLHTPGYVYAYAFGELLVLALYARYEAASDMAAWAEAYLDLLRAGGSDYPHVLVAKLGVDLQDPSFWNGGLDLIERMIADAESLAATPS